MINSNDGTIGPKRIIYDLGSNNGDNIPYYLQKADLVVAVEANPALTKLISERFQGDINSGRLIVINCVLTVGNDGDSVPFYIHKKFHVLSTFPPPKDSELGDYEKVLLPSKNVATLVQSIGTPYYIKIDIEHYDHIILKALFEKNIKPLFLSVESHSIEVFATLIAFGGYKSYNLIDGIKVVSQYKNSAIKTNAGLKTYSFPDHSAGPFGEDIATPWMESNDFFRFLALEGLGWKDIHATNEIEPQLISNFNLYKYYSKERKAKLLKLCPQPLRKFFK